MPKSNAPVVQGYVIDPIARTITPGLVDTSPEGLRRIVGSEAMPRFFWEGDVVISDRLNGDPLRCDFTWGGLKQFWRTVVVVGMREGEYRDAEIEAAELARWIEWPDGAA